MCVSVCDEREKESIYVVVVTAYTVIITHTNTHTHPSTHPHTHTHTHKTTHTQGEKEERERTDGRRLWTLLLTTWFSLFLSLSLLSRSPSHSPISIS